MGLALLAMALASILAGAVIAILPAMALALVHLFYDSAGEVLILLGKLLMLLLPQQTDPSIAHGVALPYFRMLEDHLGLVLMRSLGGAILCSIAFAALFQDRGRDRRLVWLMTGCSVLAAAITGQEAAVALAPAIVVGLLRLVRSGII